MTPLAGWSDTTANVLTTDTLARLDNEVVELTLLLPRWQAATLEEEARLRGMTTGQMLRRVIADLFPEHD